MNTSIPTKFPDSLSFSCRCSKNRKDKGVPIPIPSMYGIFTYIWLIFMVNVGKYTIHAWYGIGKDMGSC